MCGFKKKIEKVFTSKFVRTGPLSYKERIYRAAVSPRLRNTGVDWTLLSTIPFLLLNPPSCAFPKEAVCCLRWINLACPVKFVMSSEMPLYPTLQNYSFTPSVQDHFSIPLWHYGIMCICVSVLTHRGRGHLNCLNARSRGLNNLNQL